jgi:hypothetical protein
MDKMNITRNSVKQTGKHNLCGEVTIELSDHDADITLVLPNGDKVQLQYRVEAPSIDVCLDTATSVTCWQGDDMDPAPKMAANPDHPNAKKLDALYAQGHIRCANQVVIDLNPAILN